MAKTKYWRHADPEDLNGASECLYATQGEKPGEIHMKMAIESWLSERNQFDWDKQKGNNYSNVMWKSTHMSESFIIIIIIIIIIVGYMMGGPSRPSYNLIV